MHLPTFPRAMPVTRRVQTDFRGYDHRPGCPEGGIYEMTNGSAAAVFHAAGPHADLSDRRRQRERTVRRRRRTALVHGPDAVF